MRESIAFDLASDILEQLKADVIQVLETDISSIPGRITEVEVLLKTERDEMLLLTFNTVADTLQAMARLVSDRPDISDLLQPRSHQ
jgi:hypothetical protein